MAESTTTPVCSRCGASDAEVLIATEWVIYWYCPTCGWVSGMPQRHPDAQTDLDEVTYLMAESRCLRDQANALLQDCRALRHGAFDVDTLRRHRRVICAFHESVRNHIDAVNALLLSRRQALTASARPSASQTFAA